MIFSTLNPPAIPLQPTATETPQKPEDSPPTWTPTTTPTITPTPPARIEKTPTPTITPRSTTTPLPPTITPTPIPPELINPDFDMLMTNRIPGWQWYAFVNYRTGQEEPADSETSFAEPFFSAADDAARRIDGSTLKIETERWLRFRAWIHQSVTVTAGSTLYFEIKASAYSSLDRLIVKAGIDPTGQDNCQQARWGEEVWINQDSGVVVLTSPRVIVPPVAVEAEAEPPDDPPDEPQDTEAPSVPNVGRVTVCFFAEPSYPHVNNAVFFDQAKLILVP